MRRRLGNTAGRGSYTFLLAFSFQTRRVTMHPGCGSTASVTGTRRISTAGALQSCVSYTGSCARGVVGLWRTRHLVDACTCLQLWMWARFPVGRPEVLARREWFQGQPPSRQPTWAYLWDQVRVPYVRLERTYIEFTNELDTLTRLV